MLKLNKKKSNFGLITKLILINSIVFISIFIFLIFNNIYTKNNLNREIANIYKLNLDHVSAKLEKSLKDIKYFIYMQREDNELISNSLIHSYDKANILYLRDLQKQLMKLEEVVPYIEQISIHFMNFNKVVNTDGVTNTNVFKYDNKNINLDEIINYNKPTLIVNRNIYYAFTYNNIQIIIQIDKQEMLKSFYPSINYLSDNEIFLLDKKGNIMLSTLPQIEINHIKPLLKNKKEEINLNGISYCILNIEFNEGKCYLLYDTFETSKRLKEVNKYTIVILIVFILINLLVILYNMKEFIIPMNAIVTDITTLNCRKSNNQIEFISNTIKDLQHTNTEMKKELESQINIIQHNILLKIISKQYIDNCRVRVLEDIKQMFDKYIFICAVIEDSNGEKDFELINKFENYLKVNYIHKTILFDSKYNTYIIKYDEQDNSTILNNISKFACKNSKCKFMLFGLSGIHSNIMEMNQAYNQSKIAMYNQLVSEKKQYDIDCYENIKKESRTKIILSLSEEQQLINNIVNGNHEAINKFFDKEVKDKIVKISYKQIYDFYNYLLNLLQIVLNIKEVNLQEIYSLEIVKISNSKNIYMIHDITKEIYLDSIENYFYKNNKTYDLIVEYILNNYDKDISIEIIADKIHLTPNYIARCFKKYSGKTIKKYIDEVRIEKAKELIKKYPNLKIEDVGTKVGINSINTFIRLFKKYTGCTPGQYKKTI